MRLPTCAEWDQLADVVEEPNTAIHWRNMYSWCQNADPDWASYRAVRGYYSARRWSHYHAARRDMRVGFRPALDTLDFDPYPLTELLSQLEPSI